MNRTIFDNPKAGQAVTIRLGEKDGLITRTWRRRLERVFRSLIPRHVPDDRQVWLHTPEDVDRFWERISANDSSLAAIEYVCITETVADIYDIVEFFSTLCKLLPSHARIVYTTYNWLWAPLFRLSGILGFSRQRRMGNFYREKDLDCFMEMAGWENTRHIRKHLIPVTIPVLSYLCDNLLLCLPGIRRLALNSIFIARSRATTVTDLPTVSVLIPCKNEADNIEAACARMPTFNTTHTQLVFIDDKSTDTTRARIVECQDKFRDKNITLVDGDGIGKGEAVRAGMQAATGDICMILDADLTVIPEDLPQFYDAMRHRVADFIHGTRLVYPQEGGAMRLANIVGNVGFSVLFSYILEQRITDTLCGTKVFWRRDWPCFEEMRLKLKRIDRWGDYNLIFGAARFGLKIGELPVRYFERLEGTTKMSKRLKNGLIMLRVAWHALWSVKFWTP